jgi:cation/acetate symporter
MPTSYGHLTLAALSLAAAGLFPAMLLAIWWRRANGFGAFAGMLAGFGVAACLAYAEFYDASVLTWLDPAGLTDWAKSLGAERAALAGVPIGLLIAVLVSLVTPTPGPAQRAFADALLSPRDMPAADDAE